MEILTVRKKGGGEKEGDSTSTRKGRGKSYIFLRKKKGGKRGKEPSPEQKSRAWGKRKKIK